ncbi:unnamed protein product [Leptosia nina]|uniref:tRNA-binding domain-containing protein n=1 Tax=Leptosia nina TaxID=320188 RepID=A0AAV1K3K0_9NEOP
MSVNFANILNNAEFAEKKLIELRSKLEEIKKVKVLEAIRAITQENTLLSSKIEDAKAQLIRLEILHGKQQYQLPGKAAISQTATIPQNPVSNQNDSETLATKNSKKGKKESVKKEKIASQPAGDDSVVDVRKLDFRIGKIIEINKHPDADSLYIEKIDCGEENPRTVVSGLVNHVPIEEMRDRIVMVLCNLKPAKMRGITSEAMVMCASSPDKVEVLIPPASAVPGDLVSCDGYPREPEPQLNPKKKIFETCAPDLKTDDNKVACYKGSPLLVAGKGPVVAATLHGVSVK